MGGAGYCSCVRELSDPSFSSYMDAPVIKTEIPGPKTKAALAAQNRLETVSRTYTGFFPLSVSEGKGSTLKDVDGNVFIDWFAGVCVIALGHGNPIVLGAMQKQLERISHINEMPTEVRTEFLKVLDSTLPGSLGGRSKTMFTVTGADACEAAISLARHVTRKRTIVAFGGAYHGVHGSIVGATANRHYREYASVPPYGIHHLPYPYTYRFPYGVGQGEEAKSVIDSLEYLIKDSSSGPDEIGGVIVEPVQGEGGYVVPPPDFLPMLREITEKYSVPLIVDEVQTGVGRTGKIWASEHSSITPDIMCISKAIGGGIPLSMMSYRSDYDDNLPQGFHLGTYRGNPVGLAAGNAILKHLKESDLLSKVARTGARVKSHFEEIASGSRTIGEVRGLGFMVGVELVEDRKSRTPSQDAARRLRSSMLGKGVLMHTCGHFGNVMRFMAPLTIEDELVTRGLEIFDSSLRETEASM